MKEHDLNQQIDDELRSFLSAFDEYQACTIELAAACKSGCFDIARARKAMSCQGSTVTSLQYPSLFAARVGVEVDTDSDFVMRLKTIDRAKDAERGADSELTRSVDPLKWFGILVPEHLRNSQRTFSKGLEVNSRWLCPSAFRQHWKRRADALEFQSAVGAARAHAKFTRHYNQYKELLERKGI